MANKLTPAKGGLMNKLTKHGDFIKVAVFLLFIALCYFDSYYSIIGIRSCVNAIAVIGLVIISGYTRQIHLGQMAFVGLGAYTSAIMLTKLGVNFWLTIPCAIIVSGLVGALLGIPTLRLRDGPYLALVTQIFGEVIYVLIINLEPITGGTFGSTAIPSPHLGSISLANPSRRLLVVAVITMLAFFVANKICKSKYGRFFISIRESEAAAQSVGVNTMKYKIIAFTLSSAFAGLAGVFYAQCFGVINATEFRWSFSLELLSMAIIGGMASLEGGVLGAVTLTVLLEVLRGTFNAQWRMIVYGVLMILVLAFLPDGLISLIGKNMEEIRQMFRDRLKVFKDDRRRPNKKKRTAA